jgi:hypothetical protein
LPIEIFENSTLPNNVTIYASRFAAKSRMYPIITPILGSRGVIKILNVPKTIKTAAGIDAGTVQIADNI